MVGQMECTVGGRYTVVSLGEGHLEGRTKVFKTNSLCVTAIWSDLRLQLQKVSCYEPDDYRNKSLRCGRRSQNNYTKSTIGYYYIKVSV